MPDIFTTDVPFICKSMQEILNDSNGVKSAKMKTVRNQLSEYVEIQKYKYEDGRTFAVLSSRFYTKSNILDYYVMFNTDWYNKEENIEKELVYRICLKVKNRELNAPIFLNMSVFNGEIGEEEYDDFIMGNLRVYYKGCVLNGDANRYQMSKSNKFENCIFTGK